MLSPVTGIAMRCTIQIILIVVVVDRHDGVGLINIEPPHSTFSCGSSYYLLICIQDDTAYRINTTAGKQGIFKSE